MRYGPDHKAKSKRSILELAGASLKKNGFGGVGVDDLAAAAGVTSGAFYSNFEGKEGFLKEVINEFLGQPFVGQEAKTTKDIQEQLKAFLNVYLDIDHCATPNCVMPTLSSDVSRASPSVRNIYQDRMDQLIEKMAKAMTGSAIKKRKKAWAVLSLMIGAVTIGRALPKEEAVREVMAAALETSLSILA